jgi:nicotinamidase/pyrazinamidase
MDLFSPTSALVVVDMQNDFTDPTGSLSVGGGEVVLGTVNAAIIRAVTSGSPVFYTQDWHPESTPHFAKDGGIWPVHCVGGTWGAELHPRLIVAGPIVRKGTNGEDGYSGFTMRHPTSGDTIPTELESLLTGIEQVVVVGLALDYCVKDTALDAARLGFATHVPRATTAAVNLDPGDGERAAATLAAAGVSVV